MDCCVLGFDFYSSHCILTQSSKCFEPWKALLTAVNIGLNLFKSDKLGSKVTNLKDSDARINLNFKSKKLLWGLSVSFFYTHHRIIFRLFMPAQQISKEHFLDFSSSKWLFSEFVIFITTLENVQLGGKIRLQCIAKSQIWYWVENCSHAPHDLRN